jgi:AcrR family transcriptional regulator
MKHVAAGRKQEILAAAEKLFYERGFDATGVDAIAEEAGITGGAIYRHFGGKNEILAVLLDQAVDTVLEQISTSTDNPDRDLRNLIELHVRYALEHPRLAGIWNNEQRSLADPHRSSHLHRQRQYVDCWRSALRRRYPYCSQDRLDGALRAMQALMLSESKQPSRAGSNATVEQLLVNMTLSSLTALEDADR